MMIHVLDLQFAGIPECIAAFLMETEAGPVLFETGPHSTLPNLERAIKKYRYQLSDIQHVFITHIHLDHAGAAWALAEQGATVYLHPQGARHLQDPSRLLASAKQIYQNRMDELWGTLKPIRQEQLRQVNQGEVIMIGAQQVTGWHTPGHAIHHIAWQIGQELICGDVAGVRIGDGLTEPPCPPPDIQIEQWMASLDLIEKLKVDALLLTHFGRFTDVVEHLHQLRAVLTTWSQWFRPYAKKGMAEGELIPLFDEFVQAARKKAGIPAESIKKYDNANPIWMSVAGLMRYWRKKEEG